jgi:hypothetical protein
MAGLEKDLERKIGIWCKAHGYFYYKFTSPSKRCVPDRICIAPGGKIGFLELKRKGNKPTPGQALEIFRLIEQGCTADWVDNYEDAITFLEGLRS